MLVFVRLDDLPGFGQGEGVFNGVGDEARETPGAGAGFYLAGK
ncbi:hypothetical protein [Streptomyces sp. NBC_01429]|nr:hypothetical protein [Streptomyces sp. NBC_01429]